MNDIEYLILNRRADLSMRPFISASHDTENAILDGFGNVEKTDPSTAILHSVQKKTSGEDETITTL